MLTALTDVDADTFAKDLGIQTLMSRFHGFSEAEATTAQRKTVFEWVVQCLSVASGKGPALGGIVKLCVGLSDPINKLGVQKELLDECSVYLTMAAGDTVTFAPAAIEALEEAKEVVTNAYKGTVLEPLHMFPAAGKPIIADFAKRVADHKEANAWRSEVLKLSLGLEALRPQSREAFTDASKIMGNYFDTYGAEFAAVYRSALLNDIAEEAEKLITVETHALKVISVCGLAIWMQSMAFAINAKGAPEQNLGTIQVPCAAWAALFDRASSPTALTDQLNSARVSRRPVC